MTQEQEISAPIISVIMPVYNAMPYLNMAIDSIINQTFTNWELIIINGNNTDGSSECAEQYAKNDPRIRVLYEPQRGVWCALNMGINHANGEYIARMDADDISLPTRLQKQYEYLQNNPHIDILGSHYQIIDADDKPGEICRWPAEKHVDAVWLLNNFRSCFCHPSVLMRKNAIISAGLYRNISCEDYDLWHRMAKHGQLANMGEVLLFYRVHGNNISINGGGAKKNYNHVLMVNTMFQCNVFLGFDKFTINPYSGTHQKILFQLLYLFNKYIALPFSYIIYATRSPSYIFTKITGGVK